ncbi:hypothetical protein DPM13_16505 [Paracoccus mutanolyticus]|uniref:Uncharacterized protein n=1 Tax=Paracoccus mutanolyticus TaxID=1499308 RepID=A0ABM6WTJ7_9RHOB|nr:hypothetical protein [Paracoccus mutanolyticus]AWX94013.1 hypothetical protein DPM13_16505 [Paracoccus mutanolyticus]
MLAFDVGLPCGPGGRDYIATGTAAGTLLTAGQVDLSPDPVLTQYETDYRWLAQVYESLKPSSGTGRLLWHRLGAKTIELIHENVHVLTSLYLISHRITSVRQYRTSVLQRAVGVDEFRHLTIANEDPKSFSGTADGAESQKHRHQAAAWEIDGNLRRSVFLAHRIIWKMAYGDEPELIDLDTNATDKTHNNDQEAESHQPHKSRSDIDPLVPNRMTQHARSGWCTSLPQIVSLIVVRSTA